MKTYSKYAVAVLAALVGYGAWSITRPPDPIDVAAEKSLRGLFTGEYGCFRGVLLEQELADQGWSENEARRFYHEFLSPRLRRFKINRVIARRSINGGAQGQVVYEVLLPNGRTSERNYVLDYADSGPFRSVYTDLVTLWWLECVETHPNATESEIAKHYFWNGMRRDGDQLLSLKYTKLLSYSGGKLEDDLRETVQRAKRGPMW
jgi:hypothetical protein